MRRPAHLSSWRKIEEKKFLIFACLYRQNEDFFHVRGGVGGVRSFVNKKASPDYCPGLSSCRDLGFSMNQPESGVKGHVILLVCG